MDEDKVLDEEMGVRVEFDRDEEEEEEESDLDEVVDEEDEEEEGEGEVRACVRVFRRDGEECGCFGYCLFVHLPCHLTWSSHAQIT